MPAAKISPGSAEEALLLSLFESGKSSIEIAAALSVAPGTVKRKLKALGRVMRIGRPPDPSVDRTTSKHKKWWSGVVRDPARHSQAKARRRKYVLKKHYGLTTEEYEELLASQGGVCLVCGRGPDAGKPLFVDHCHSTGNVRGLLCSNCNTLIGYASDDPVVLRNAVAYLSLPPYKRGSARATTDADGRPPTGPA